MPKTVILTPTYNERENIERLVTQLFTLYPAICVLVIDDNSPDGTGEVVQTLMRHYPNLSLLSRPQKNGLGEAYKAGMHQVLQDPTVTKVITMDADGSHAPEYIAAMLVASKSAELVIGSRYVPGGRTEGWERWRILLSFFGNRYCRMVTRMPAHDFTAGFTLIDAQTLRKLDLHDLTLAGYAFLIELKYRLWKKGARVSEVPIVFRNRTEGVSKLNGHIVSEGIVAPWRIVFKTPH